MVGICKTAGGSGEGKSPERRGQNPKVPNRFLDIIIRFLVLFFGEF
jgi:hypothetical protein